MTDPTSSHLPTTATSEDDDDAAVNSFTSSIVLSSNPGLLQFLVETEITYLIF